MLLFSSDLLFARFTITEAPKKADIPATKATPQVCVYAQEVDCVAKIIKKRDGNPKIYVPDLVGDRGFEPPTLRV